MRQVRVMTIFGTRPEAIKMAPLVAELQRRPGLEPVCCVTAQHREMSIPCWRSSSSGPITI